MKGRERLNDFNTNEIGLKSRWSCRFTIFEYHIISYIQLIEIVMSEIFQNKDVLMPTQ